MDQSNEPINLSNLPVSGHQPDCRSVPIEVGEDSGFIEPEGVLNELQSLPEEGGHTTLAVDQVPDDSFAFNNAVASADRPRYDLYSAQSVALASFFGGIVGGSLVLAINYWLVQYRIAAMLVLLIGMVASLVLEWGQIHSTFHSTVFILVVSALMTTAAVLLQGPLIRRHKERGGKPGSRTEAFGLGLLGSVLSLALLIGVFGIETIISVPFGPRLAVSKNHEIYYSRGATRDDAARLGQFLKEDEWFNDGLDESVLLSKSGPLFVVSVFYDDGAWNKKDVLNFYDDYAARLSGEVFSGLPVQIEFRSYSNRVMHRLEAKTGVSRREWQMHVNRAEQAANAGNYAEAERHYRDSITEAEKHELLRKQVVWSLNNVGHQRLNQALTDDVDTQFRRAIEIADVVCGPGSYEVGYALNGLARWESHRGNLSEAEAFYRRALSIREALADVKPDDYAETMESLVSVLIHQEKFSAAEELQLLLVKQTLKTAGADSTAAAVCLSQLGWLQWRSGNYAEAKESLTRSFQTFEKMSDPDISDHCTCLWRLGIVYHSFGEKAKAEDFFQRAIALLQDTGNSDGLLMASFRERLAAVFFDQARYEEAQRLYRQVLENREKVLGPDHVDVADSLVGLGSVNLEMGNYLVAETQLKRASDLFEKSARQQSGRLRTADCFHKRARLYHVQGRYADAEPMYRKTLEIREAVLGPDHDDVAETVSALSELYSDCGDFSAAEPLAYRAHEIAARNLGKTHPFLVKSLYRLAMVQSGQKKLREAEQTLRQALEIGDTNFGSEHPSMAEIQNGLGGVLLQQERPQEAELYLAQALKSLTQSLGPNHPDLVGPLNNLGLTYEKRGDLIKAEWHLAQSLALAEKSFGEDHLLLLPILQNYSKVLRHLQRIDDARKLENRWENIRAKNLPKNTRTVII